MSRLTSELTALTELLDQVGVTTGPDLAELFPELTSAYPYRAKRMAESFDIIKSLLKSSGKGGLGDKAHRVVEDGKGTRFTAYRPHYHGDRGQ